MSILKNLKTSENVEEEIDSVGGSRVLDSGAYDMTIDLAYLDFSKGGAASVVFHFTNAMGQNLRQTFWVTSGNEKGNKNYYVDRSGKNRYLPGFTAANNICLLTVGEELGDLEPEEKIINIYNFDLKKEAPTKKQVYTDLIGQDITLGVIKEIVDKNTKDDSGNYVPTGETREINEVDKIFRAEDHLTVVEIKAEAEEATFYDTWVYKNKGTVKNKSSVTDTTSGTSNAAPASTGGKKTSLFGKK